MSVRALIVGINYEPESTGIAPYTTCLAEHLASVGNQIAVVTGMPHYPEWRIHASYRARLRVTETRNGVNVRRARQYTPSHQSAFGRSLYELSFFLQTLLQRHSPRPDCIVGVVPSLGGAVAAALHARRYRVPFGLIFQDLVGLAASQSGVPGGRIAALPATALEGWAVRQADSVAVVAESFRPYLERAGVQPERILHLPNWARGAPSTGRAADVRRKLGWPPEVRIVLHAGNLGYKQGLENAIDAVRLALVERLPIRLVLMGDGNDRRRLESLVEHSLPVQFLDPQPSDIFMDVLQAADVLLVNERASVLDMSLPSKITSYFQAGRPVVAAVRRDGATARELHRSGGALVADAGDPAALLAAIRTVLGDPALAGRLVKQAGSYAQLYLDSDSLLRRAERFVEDLARIPRSSFSRPKALPNRRS